MIKINFLLCSSLGTLLCLALAIPLQAKSAEPKVDGIPLVCISEAEKLQNSLYFARIYAAVGQKDKALVFLAHAEKEGHQIEDEYVFLKEIASIYLKLGYKDKALGFLKMLQATSPKTPKEILFKDTVLVDIADNYAQAKEYTQALQIAKTLKTTDNQASALIKIARVYAKNSEKERAVLVLSESEKLLTARDYQPMNRRLFADIAHLYTELGEKDKSIILLNRVTQQLSTTSAKDVLDLVYISAEFAALGQTAQVEEIFSRILKITDRLKDPTDTLVDVAGTYAKTGQTDKAEKLFDQLLKYAKRTIFPGFQTNIFLSSVTWYAELGQPDRAWELLNTFGEDLFKVSSLEIIVQAYAKVGNLQKALAVTETGLKIAQSIDEVPIRDNVLELDIIKSYIILEEYDKALQIAKSLPPERRDRWIEPLTCASQLSTRTPIQ